MALQLELDYPWHMALQSWIAHWAAEVIPTWRPQSWHLMSSAVPCRRPA